jgi:hypothetical protein
VSLQRHRGAVRLFGRLTGFSGWLQSLPVKLMPPPFRLVQLGSAYWQSRVLYLAARLDIAGVLGDTTLDTQEIARRLSADADAVFRVLRMLAAMGVFEQTAPRCFRNNRVSACLREDHPQSVRAMVLMHNAEPMSRSWYEQLEAGVRSGEVPFELAHGQALFAYLDTHAELDTLFSHAMDAVEALIGESFATDFDWGRFQRVIDVGGGKGAKSVAILKHHPALLAMVVDRAQVVRDARDHWQGRVDKSLLARIGYQPGNLLESVPPADGDKDVYLLSAVLHGFDDETCVKALRNLTAAVGGSGARIAVMEMVLPEMGADLASASFDLQMLVNTRGRERTLVEWRALFARSGLELEQSVRLRSFAKVLVLKAAAH